MRNIKEVEFDLSAIEALQRRLTLESSDGNLPQSPVGSIADSFLSLEWIGSNSWWKDRVGHGSHVYDSRLVNVICAAAVMAAIPTVPLVGMAWLAGNPEPLMAPIQFGQLAIEVAKQHPIATSLGAALTAGAAVVLNNP